MGPSCIDHRGLLTYEHFSLVVQYYVNAPRIMGKSLEISPLVQIFAVLAGGEIGGVVGALISVPAVATLRILWKRLTSEKGPDAPVAPISGGASSLEGG